MNRQQTKKCKKKEYVTFSFRSEEREKEKIHFDEKEKSALLFYVCVRSPIDNYENKE
jgi:hypothetical protein